MAKANPLGLKPLDITEYLDNDRVIAKYFDAAIQDDDPDALARTVLISRRREVSIATVAREVGLGL